eukprot:COSAG03_NODE_169_length_11255_cov_5.793385_10_plen_131_part_00
MRLHEAAHATGENGVRRPFLTHPAPCTTAHAYAYNESVSMEGVDRIAQIAWARYEGTVRAPVGTQTRGLGPHTLETAVTRPLRAKLRWGCVVPPPVRLLDAYEQRRESDAQAPVGTTEFDDSGEEDQELG